MTELRLDSTGITSLGGCYSLLRDWSITRDAGTRDPKKTKGAICAKNQTTEEK